MYEEAGVRVADIRYHGSQAFPYPRSLMLGFVAVADPAAAPLRTDPDELIDAQWFTRERIARVLDGSDDSFTLPNRSSIAHQLVLTWLRGG
ncbi:NUDIX domain-containing protein [Catellatospora coxensis]